MSTRTPAPGDRTPLRLVTNSSSSTYYLRHSKAASHESVLSHSNSAQSMATTLTSSSLSSEGSCLSSGTSEETPGPPPAPKMGFDLSDWNDDLNVIASDHDRLNSPSFFAAHVRGTPLDFEARAGKAAAGLPHVQEVAPRVSADAPDDAETFAPDDAETFASHTETFAPHTETFAPHADAPPTEPFDAPRDDPFAVPATPFGARPRHARTSSLAHAHSIRPSRALARHASGTGDDGDDGDEPLPPLPRLSASRSINRPNHPVLELATPSRPRTKDAARTLPIRNTLRAAGGSGLRSAGGAAVAATPAHAHAPGQSLHTPYTKPRRGSISGGARKRAERGDARDTCGDAQDASDAPDPGDVGPGDTELPAEPLTPFDTQPPPPEALLQTPHTPHTPHTPIYASQWGGMSALGMTAARSALFRADSATGSDSTLMADPEDLCEENDPEMGEAYAPEAAHSTPHTAGPETEAHEGGASAQSPFPPPASFKLPRSTSFRPPNRKPADAYMTPQTYKDVRPLQAAFMSTGLVSKRLKHVQFGRGQFAREQMSLFDKMRQSRDESLDEPRCPKSFSTTALGPAPFRGPRISTGSLPPDTPVKKHPSMHFTPTFTTKYKGRYSEPLLGDLDRPGEYFESNFAVVRSVGDGAFSHVFEAYDRARDGVYAVKRTKNAFLGTKDRMRRYEEVDILRECSHTAPSPHIVSFITAWEQSGHLYIETELCASGTLALFLETYGSAHELLDETRVWKILTEVGAGLRHVHSLNIIHLDLKPANIFVTTHGFLKIGDFGLATRWPRLPPSLQTQSLSESMGHAPPQRVPMGAPPRTASCVFQRAQLTIDAARTNNVATRPSANTPVATRVGSHTPDSRFVPFRAWPKKSLDGHSEGPKRANADVARRATADGTTAYVAKRAKSASSSSLLADDDFLSIASDDSDDSDLMTARPSEASMAAQASRFPRIRAKSNGDVPEDLEREGDREYIAPEILSAGRYGKEADVFSLGLIILEAAANVVLPDNGPAWQKLRSDDFSDVNLSRFSPELVDLIYQMLNKNPDERISIEDVMQHRVVRLLKERLDASIALLEDRPTEHIEKTLPVLGAVLPQAEAFLAGIFAEAQQNESNDTDASDKDAMIVD